MNHYIFDASATASLVLPDESSKKMDKIISEMEEPSTFWVPTLWWSETSNILTQAIKQNRIKTNDIDTIQTIFSKLNLVTDVEYNYKYQKEIISLSVKHGLSSYDATYLELAMRKGGRLLTLDKKLSKIAKDISGAN